MATETTQQPPRFTGPRNEIGLLLPDKATGVPPSVAEANREALAAYDAYTTARAAMFSARAKNCGAVHTSTRPLTQQPSQPANPCPPSASRQERARRSRSPTAGSRRAARHTKTPRSRVEGHPNVRFGSRDVVVRRESATEGSGRTHIY